MPSVYDRLRGASERLLDRFAQDGVYASVRAVVPNPDPLLPPAVMDSQESIKAVVRGITADMRASVPDLAAGDLQVITDYRFTPREGQRVLIADHERVILAVEPIPAAGDPVAWRFYVR